MKNKLFLALGILASFGVATPLAYAQDSESNRPIVDIQGEFASFDDVITGLAGTIEINEQTRLYQVEDLNFQLSLEQGYSFVNEQAEPLLLETSTADESVSIITYTSPILFNEEFFVPISYIERLLNLTYTNGQFEKDGEPLFKGEAFVTVTPEEEPEISEDEKTEENSTDSSVSEDVTSESKPNSTPEANKPSGNTSSTPENLTVKQVLTNVSSLKLEAGQTGKVNAVVDPFNVSDASITWSSSNTGIATVDGKGNVTAISAGSATLTATSNMNPSVKATVSVTVTPPPVIVASSVSVSKGNVSLEVGGSEKVSAWVAPENTTNKGIQWSSENSAIASVDANGNIVAKAAGTTRIFATASSNGNASASITVTVKAKPAPAKPIYSGDSVIQQLLNEGMYADYDPNTAFWSSNGPDIVSAFWDVVVFSAHGIDGLDLTIEVYGPDWTTAYSYAQKALNKIVPSGTSTLMNALKNDQEGSWTFDGRNVTIKYGRIYIYPKY